ncbi:hypothetical protein N0V93_006431 [Gnomoniopsis smithogilvyi]|uniref:Uncharacterized protein n=1 Tax=Gnomoniopsis smithogilvyi TaxID=1191159 RepID=A0A9W9CUQ5_9PEZI|nr:hypothetical protein N0V93_006431 [Gnomoniopsis smithogilvyi]
MTTAAVAAEAETTNWRTYDGGVLPDFLGIAVAFPVMMGLFLVLPAALCYCCLARGRVVPYTPPNMGGAAGYDRKGPYAGSVNHGSVAEK